MYDEQAASGDTPDGTGDSHVEVMDTSDTAGLLVGDGEPVVDTRTDHTDSCANLATDAVESLTVGGSFVLVSDHDPIGIYYMLKAEQPGLISWDVLEQGPSRWQVRIGKAAGV